MSRISIRDVHEKYERGEPLTMLTAYDAPTARQVDAGGVDVILVGDTAGDNHLGYESTLPVTLDEALSNTAAVDRTVKDAMMIGDPPFLTSGCRWRSQARTPGGSSRKPARTR